LVKYGGRIASPNSVKWMFELKGIIRIPKTEIPDKEDLELKLIEQGVEDIKDEDEEIAIFVKPEDLQRVENWLKNQGLKIDYAEIEWFAKKPVEINKDVQEKVDKLFVELDNNPDVDDYYSNIQ